MDADKLLNGDNVEKGAEKERLRPLISNRIQRAGFASNHRAGIVLTFGGGPTAKEDTAMAREVNDLLPDVMPSLFDAGTVFRPFIDLNVPRGFMRVEVYIFTVR